MDQRVSSLSSSKIPQRHDACNIESQCLGSYNQWHPLAHCTATTSTYSNKQNRKICWKSRNKLRFVLTRTWLRYVRVFAVADLSVCLSVGHLSVTLLHPTQGVEPFGNISSPLCMLAILWPPCKILQRSSQGNPSIWGVKPSIWGVKCKKGSKIQQFRTYRRLYLNNSR